MHKESMGLGWETMWIQGVHLGSDNMALYGYILALRELASSS